MQSKLLNHSGFTLIEIIAVLVLGGIMLALAGMGIVQVTEGLILAQQNAATTLKAQVALNRLEKEFHIITGVTSGSGTSLTYTSNKGGIPGGSHTLTYDPALQTLTLDNDPLVDKVASFALTYRATYNGPPTSTWNSSHKVIDAAFSLATGGANVPFTLRITPRIL